MMNIPHNNFFNKRPNGIIGIELHIDGSVQDCSISIANALEI